MFEACFRFVWCYWLVFSAIYFCPNSVQVVLRPLSSRRTVDLYEGINQTCANPFIVDLRLRFQGQAKTLGLCLPATILCAPPILTNHAL